MARPAYKPRATAQTTTHIREDYNQNPFNQRYAGNVRPAITRPFPGNVRKRKKTNPIALFIRLAAAALFIFYIVPHYIDNVTRPSFMHTAKYPAVTADFNQMLYPTKTYINNLHVLGVDLLQGTELKKPKMQPLYETYSMPLLEAKLNNLTRAYPALTPSVYVWDYESGKFAGIGEKNVYPAASIIKIPVLIQLFKSIEAGQVSLYDRIPMTDYFLSEGSGSLQFKGKNAVYSVDDLARVMITESDNTATNVLMSSVGGMNDVNSGLRTWGLQKTRVNDWLPDLPGTNVTTAKEMATMLYNIDNPSFLTLASREKIVDYMSHVHNNRLIQAGLPQGALFIHKTGDIGKMLGDAGIVYTPNGKKYIVVMLVNRPYNSPLGKEFIVKASSVIYAHMTSESI